MKVNSLIGIAIIFGLLACNNGAKKSSWELLEEDLAKENARIDSINMVYHKRIDDSLRVYDKGIIIDSIHFGMSRQEFDKAFKTLKTKVNNRISINGVEFWLSDIDMDFGKDNQLHIFALEKTYVSEVSINSGDMSKTRVYDESKEIKKKLYEHFTLKYGEPIILKNNKSCHIDDAELLSWIFSTRRIDLKLLRRNLILFSISETEYYNRQKEISDSLENVYQQNLKKAHDISEEYGSQI